jgi:hypothetical protein
MEFEVDHLKEPFFLSRIAFWLMEKCALILELQAAENSHFEYLINIYGIFLFKLAVLSSL